MHPTQFAVCLSPLHPTLTTRFARNAQHDTSKVPRLPHSGGLQSAAPAAKSAIHFRKTTQKCCACHTKRTTFDTSIMHVRMSQGAMPATQLGTCANDRFCSFPRRHADATRTPENQDETGGKLKMSISCETASNFHSLSLQNHFFLMSFPNEPQNLMGETRCFVQGVRQLSSHHMYSHVKQCHGCHRIYTLSPLDATLTMRFARSIQHDTSKVLRLPRKMTVEVSKVLRPPRKHIATFDT